MPVKLLITACNVIWNLSRCGWMKLGLWGNLSPRRRTLGSDCDAGRLRRCYWRRASLPACRRCTERQASKSVIQLWPFDAGARRWVSAQKCVITDNIWRKDGVSVQALHHMHLWSTTRLNKELRSYKGEPEIIKSMASAYTRGASSWKIIYIFRPYKALFILPPLLDVTKPTNTEQLEHFDCTCDDINIHLSFQMATRAIGRCKCEIFYECTHKFKEK